jgi:hypothetical protein
MGLAVENRDSGWDRPFTANDAFEFGRDLKALRVGQTVADEGGLEGDHWLLIS